MFPKNITNIKEPVPKAEPKSRYGNPKSYKVFGKKYYTLNSNKNFTQSGKASWYGTKFHGRRTSSGEVYDMYAMTGAHKTLPLPTYAKVTNTDNNKSIIIKINDRGPFHGNRILDLSYAAASKLDVLANGTANIQLTALNPESNPKDNSKYNTVDSIKNNKELIYIQIGAFTNRYNAERLLKTTANLFEQPALITNNRNNNDPSDLFKVHIGPFPAHKVEDIKSKLATINITNPLTISYNSTNDASNFELEI